jgi:ribonuclease R
VADHLNSNQIATLYRVHESPDPLKVAQFKEFISTLGHTLVSRGGTRPKHFQQLVDRVKGTSEEKPIVFLMLRTMQKARYDVQSLGHFGLAAEHYTHFTSPIRRYSDLVVHRVLRRSRHQEVNRSIREKNFEELSEIAKQVSQRDKRAEEAERELLQWKKVRFMADKVGDEFDGYVIGVTAFGLFVELIEHFVEGFVHISSMADDYYRFVDKEHLLQGENTRKSYRLGASVRVQVIRVDLERRQVDLGLADILKTAVSHQRDTRRGRRALTSKNPKQKRVRRKRTAGKRRPR